MAEAIVRNDGEGDSREWDACRGRVQRASSSWLCPFGRQSVRSPIPARRRLVVTDGSLRGWFVRHRLCGGREPPRAAASCDCAVHRISAVASSGETSATSVSHT